MEPYALQEMDQETLQLLSSGKHLEQQKKGLENLFKENPEKSFVENLLEIGFSISVTSQMSLSVDRQEIVLRLQKKFVLADLTLKKSYQTSSPITSCSILTVSLV